MEQIKIGFSKSDSLLSKSIRSFMWVYTKFYLKKPTDKIWGHVWGKFPLYNATYVLEANSKAIHEKWFTNPFTGTVYYHNVYKNCVKITKWEYTEYYRNEVEWETKSLKTPLTDAQLHLLTQLALYFEGRPYDNSEILCQIVKSITGKEIGKEGEAAEHEVICSELWSTILNHIIKYFSKNPAKDNPQDIYWNENLI